MARAAHVLQDCESQWAGTFGNAKAAAVARANELQYNATRAVFPDHSVVIINYDYGQAEWWPPGDPSYPICNQTWKQFAHAIGNDVLQREFAQKRSGGGEVRGLFAPMGFIPRVQGPTGKQLGDVVAREAQGAQGMVSLDPTPFEQLAGH